jgi:pyridoxamine 5'-phosphate oxidase
VDIKDCIQFALENPMCSFATVGGDQPHVRTLFMDQADENGFYFCLGNNKQVFKQLCANPKVEICFFNHAADLGQARQLRITGVMEEIHDPAFTEKAYAARQGLEAIVGEPLRPMISTFRLHSGEAKFWTVMNAMTEDNVEVIHFN